MSSKERQPEEHRSLNEHSYLHFPTQRPNEHVLLLLRRHWTVLAHDVVQLVLALILPPVIMTFLYLYSSFTLDPGSAFYVFVVCLLSLFYLFTFLTYFHDFVDYHLDIWVVTDQRIVSIEQEGLFRRTVSEFNIGKVQDVTSEIKGKIQTFLDYGQVHIQTAGNRERFVFEDVHHPSEVAKVILQAHDRAVRRQNLQQMRDQAQYGQQLAGQSQMAGMPGVNGQMPHMQAAPATQRPMQSAQPTAPQMPTTPHAHPPAVGMDYPGDENPFNNAH